MEAKQRRYEIELMIDWLTEAGYIDYTQYTGSPSRWQVHLLGGYRHTGDVKVTHSFLSGSTAIMHIDRYCHI